METIVVRRRARGRVREQDRTLPSRVDFFLNANDLRCVLLAAAGWSTAAIAMQTGLTVGQVVYRLHKSEKRRAAGTPTLRKAYRGGTSPVAKMIATFVAGKTGPVRKSITSGLDRKGLYTSRSRGVLRDDRSLPPV